MDLLNTSLPDNNTFWTEAQNKTNNRSCFFDDNSWIYSFLPVCIILISLLGIVLNGFVLMVFCLQKKKNYTTADICLSNLVAAVLVLVSFLPFWAVCVSKRYNWTFGLIMCKLVSASILMNAYCSIYFLVLISIDRYLALVHPMSYERCRKPHVVKLGCLLVWILGFLFSLPALIHRELTYQRCLVNYPSTHVEQISQWSIFVLGFIIPILIISICSIEIIRSLRSKSHKVVNANKTGEKIETKKIEKATALLLAVLLAFLICWVPFHLIKIPIIPSMVHGCNALKALHICAQIFTYFAYFNSVLNPILYVIVGKNFQKKVKKITEQRDHNKTWNLETLLTSLKRTKTETQ